MIYYGLVLKTEKSKDVDTLFATVLLSSGKEVVVKTNLKTKAGDVINISMDAEGVKAEPVNTYDTKKSFSARYGFLSKKKSDDGKPFSVMEMEGGKIIGNIAHGHCSFSKQGSMIGYGITNFDYFDEIGKITKSLNYTGIEGNVVWGSSLVKGNSLKFSINKLLTQEYITMSGDEIKNSIKKAVDSMKFLIDTIGVHGIMYILGASIYKIEGSGDKILSNILSLSEIKFGDKKIKNNFSSVLNHIKDKISISDSLDFVIFLSEDDGEKDSSSTKKLSVTLFDKKYIVSEIKIHSSDKVYHYVNSMLYDGETYEIDATDLIWAIDNLKIRKGIYINPNSNTVSINNDKLTLNAFNLVNNVKSLASIAQDTITLKVGQKGLKIDITGTSNI